MWAKITKVLGATDPRAQMLRFHTQTGGSTLTAQQPMNNIVRVTIQALAAVLGGTQSLHTNGFDEALSLPTEIAAGLALRTQQVIAFESNVAQTVDPLGGSFFIEQLTDEVESKAWDYIEKIDAMGGSIHAIEEGFIQDEIAKAAYSYQRCIEDESKIIVGVNKFVHEEEKQSALFKVGDEIRQLQIDKLKKLRLWRNQAAVDDALKKIELAASSDDNVMPYVINAVEQYATLGEIADLLRKIYGEYKA
jgi:methylmalonyl-CoA mutase N-terminal domain/subunit